MDIGVYAVVQREGDGGVITALGGVDEVDAAKHWYEGCCDVDDDAAREDEKQVAMPADHVGRLTSLCG